MAYVVITGWNLNLQTVANPDEPRYASAARTMLRSQDAQEWLVPMFNARPHLVKPIFFYYLIAATGWFGQALGVGMVAAFRLGPLLMGLLAVAGTFLLGLHLRSARLGFLAAAILLTSAEFHKMARQLVVDMTLTAFVVWAWVFCHVALAQIANRKSKIENSSPLLPLLGFYLCLGMACMTKGPFLVALFVVVPLLLYLFWSGRLRDLKHAGLWWGAPLSLALGLWWSLALHLLGHGQDAGEFFLKENLARFTGGLDHVEHPWPFIFYLEALTENYAPWAVLLPFAAWWWFRRRKQLLALSSWLLASPCRAAPQSQELGAKSQEPRANSARWLLCALCVPFFFVGISISKRPLYLLPLYPYLSLALAWAWDEGLLSLEGQPVKWLGRAAMLIFSLFVLAVGVGFAIRLAKLGGQTHESVVLAVFCAAMAGCGCWAAREMRRGQRCKASLLVLALAALLWFGFEVVYRPISERNANRQEFYRVVDKELQGQPVVVQGEDSNEMAWYLDRPREPVDTVRFTELKARFFEAPGTKLLVSSKVLDKDPELRKALLTIPVHSMRFDGQWFLAEPDPAHPPAPEVFLPLAKHDDKGHHE